MDTGMTKSYIYTLANRIPHLLAIIFLPLAYFEIGSVYFHAVFGIIFFLTICFRIIWGIVGSKYSRFSDFHFRGLKTYILGVFGKRPSYIAHNPASSIAIVLMLVLGVLVSISGLMLWGEKEHSGIFSFLYFSPIAYLKEMHEFFANGLVGVVVIHICGVLIDKIFHKNDALNAIVNGYKKTPTQESVSLKISQKVFCFLFFAFSGLIVCSLLYPKNPILGFDQTLPKYSYSQAQKLYFKECGSCHIAYAPYTLPKDSWKKMMGELENHFGDDASLDEEDRVEIEKFLLANSAEEKKTFLSSKILAENPLVFSQSRLFAKIHRKIPQEAFTSSDVKSKANCQNCHQNAQDGYFQKSGLKIKKFENF